MVLQAEVRRPSPQEGRFSTSTALGLDADGLEHGVFDEVPVLPVVVPLAAVVLLVLLSHLHRRVLLSAPRAAVALALCVYAAGVVANTVFPIFIDKPSNTASWSSFIAATPIVGYGVQDATLNICVFVPIGMLVPLAAPKLTWPRVLAVATTVSFTIEVSQYVTARLLGGGHIADINDLLFNVVGAAIGYGLLRAVAQVPSAARLVDLFRWTESPAGTQKDPAPRATIRPLGDRAHAKDRGQ